jgi:hypothetical protein
MNRGKTWYRSIRWLAGLAGLFLMAWSTVEGKDVAALEAEFVATIDRLPAMGAEKIVDRKDAQLEFEKVCFANSGPGKEVEQEALCRAIMQRVGPTVAKPARVWLLRKVEPIGRDEVVSGLVVLLGDPDGEIRDLARRALQNNPSPKAAAALAAELAKAKDNAWRVALINALAFRRDADRPWAGSQPYRPLRSLPICVPRSGRPLQLK